MNPSGRIGGTVSRERSLSGESLDHVVGRIIGILITPDATPEREGRCGQQDKTWDPVRIHPPTLDDPQEDGSGEFIREAFLFFLLHQRPLILFAVWMSRALPADLLLEAYASGVFPMGMEDGSVRWFSPDPRGILPLADFHVPHGLRRALRKPEWELRTDTAFDEVVAACGARDDTWITPPIRKAYRELFELGHAHSVEIWRNGLLAGGLYGVALGGAFFGESMFHRVTDASKVALWHLVRLLRENGFTLLDTQWTTSHLGQFGAIEVTREEYLGMLGKALLLNPSFPVIKPD